MNLGNLSWLSISRELLISSSLQPGHTSLGRKRRLRELWCFAQATRGRAGMQTLIFQSPKPILILPDPGLPFQMGPVLFRER